jgi:hypothetical protein
LAYLDAVAAAATHVIPVEALLGTAGEVELF